MDIMINRIYHCYDIIEFNEYFTNIYNLSVSLFHLLFEIVWTLD
jgi:hypothetical protein